MIFLIHLLLAVILFFIINWIGKHSYSIGYMEISMFVKNEESPAFNFLIRVLTPVVYLIIVSSILYYLKLDLFVHNIYLVSLYYILFRLLFNLITNRGRLLNWYRQTLYWISILSISFVTYKKVIEVKANILPDFATISNELWIIILIFLFQVFNNIRLSQETTDKRKTSYIRSRYKYFRHKYISVVKKEIDNEILEAIVFSIMIYEDFNRPKVVRVIENLKQSITHRPHTLGVMQVRTNDIITDRESVTLGARKVRTAYESYLNKLRSGDESYYEWGAYFTIISNYNGGHSYSGEVAELIQIVVREFYKNSSDKLIPSSLIPQII